MRAAIFEGVGRPLSVREVPDPEPGPDEVVLKVRKCGICASDLHYTDGHSRRQYAVSMGLGHEVAGEVVAVGRSVSRVRVGDRVAAMCFSGCGRCGACRAGRSVHCENGVRMPTGGYAQYLLTTERAVIRLPESLSMADGALIEPLAVALNGVRRCRVGCDSRVLVTGAGPIGLGAIHWARHFGATAIATTELNRDRESLARMMGADHFLVPSEEGRPLSELASEALGGAPDIIIECVGVPGMNALAIQCIRPGGTIGIVGYCMVPDSFVPADAVDKGVSLLFSPVYNLETFEDVARALDAGVTAPRAMITDTISLDQLPAVFETLRERSAQVKVQVDPWSA